MRFRSCRKLFTAFLSAAVAAAGCLFLGGWSPDYTNGSKQVMDHLGIRAVLAANGDMTVTETWKIRLEDRNKPYSNLYRTFSDDVSVTGLSVTDEDRHVQYRFAGDVDPEQAGSSGLQDQCYLHPTSDQTEIGWFMPPIDEGTRNFSVTYTVKNVVQVYSDTSELYYFFLPKNFSLPISSLTGTVEFPSGGAKSAMRAWLHTDLSDSRIAIDSEKQISFSAGSIPAGTSVELRLLMPQGLFPQSERGSGKSVVSSIEAEEMQEAKADQERKQRDYLLGILDAVGAVLILAVCIVLFVFARRKNRRFHAEAPEYTRDIPKGNSPAGAANLFYFYGGLNDKEKERVYSATLLSLAEKGFLRFESGEGKKDVSLSVTGQTEQKSLTESEQVFYEMISTASEECGQTFTMKQFRKYAEKHCKFVDDKMSEFFSASKREIAGRGYYRKRPGLFSALCATGVLLFVLAVAVFTSTLGAGTVMVYIPLAMAIGGILFLIAGNAKMKLSEKGEYDLAVWNGLKEYMLEFSRMKEYGVPELALWEEYLVYASMMGISKEVCKQLKLVYPQLSDASYWDAYPGYSYLPFLFGPRYGMFGAGTAFGGADFGAALGSAMGQIGNAATRLAHPPQSSGFGGGNFGGGGFGGGGFSGGGGGFGGGGGGGVR